MSGKICWCPQPSHISLCFSKVNLYFWEERFWFSLNNFVIHGSQAVGHEPAWLLIFCWSWYQPVEEIVSSVRSSNSHSDLLLTHLPHFFHCNSATVCGYFLKKHPRASFEQGPAHLVSFLQLVFDHPVPRNLCTVPLDLHTCVLACLIRSNFLISPVCVRNIELVTFGLNSCCHVVVLTSPAPEHVWIAVQLPGHNSAMWFESGYNEKRILFRFSGLCL